MGFRFYFDHITHSPIVKFWQIKASTPNFPTKKNKPHPPFIFNISHKTFSQPIPFIEFKAFRKENKSTISGQKLTQMTFMSNLDLVFLFFFKLIECATKTQKISDFCGDPSILTSILYAGV